MSTTSKFVAELRKEVREFRFVEGCPIYDVLHEITSTGATGTLFIDFNQGGIGSIRFRVEQRLPIPEESSWHRKRCLLTLGRVAKETSSQEAKRATR